MRLNMYKFAIFATLGIVASLLQAAAPGPGDPFPALKDIPPECLMPRGAIIEFDASGNFLVNGKVRHLIGIAEAYSNLDINLRHTEGYPDSLRWLYEEPLTYENAQRLGFDAILTNPPATWARKINPRARVEGDNPKNEALAQIMIGNQLPQSVDNTLFPWSHGQFLRDRSLAPDIPPEAYNEFNSGSNNHWMPYNIFHPEGRRLYRMICENGATELDHFHPSSVITCELFNEPAYNDMGDYNKKLFAKWLDKKFGTVEKMNRAFRHRFDSFEDAASLNAKGDTPPLAVAWGLFLEQGFTELNRECFAAVKAKNPKLRVSSQVIGMNYYRIVPNSNINIYQVNAVLDSVVVPTSGGMGLNSHIEEPPKTTVSAPANAIGLPEGILCRHLFRAMADGKPLLNSETYAEGGRNGNANIVWLDMLRGCNLTYFFSWCRILSAWTPPVVAAGGRNQAERHSYILTNPYAHPPETLCGFMDGKKEVFRFADFFVPRERFGWVPREIAIMLSYPTERYGIPSGYGRKNEVLNYTSALEFSHYQIDAIWEEQLTADRALRYKALVVPAVLATYPETIGKLKEFVEQGGILVAARNNLPCDEFGNPADNSPLFDGLKLSEYPMAATGTLKLVKLQQPERLRGTIAARGDVAVQASKAWEVLGVLDGKPAVLRRKIGSGWVYFIAPAMQDYAIAAVLGAIFDRHDIRPALRLFRKHEGDMAVNIEAHVSRRDGLELAFLYNMDCYPKLLEVELPAGTECAADLFHNRLLPVDNGRAIFTMGHLDRFMLGFGTRAALEARFGALKATNATEIGQNYAKAVAEQERKKSERHDKTFSFDADTANLVPLNLREFANRSFTDDRPDDGKGGWTDQGAETCLDGVPWGIRIFAGIPCDLIRYDENDNRSCIMLRSRKLREKLPDKITGIPVNQKTAAIYFFHTSAWTYPDNAVSLIYRLRYANGSTLDVSIRNNVDISDWWSVKRPSNPSCRVAWKNRAGRGFTVMRFVNPHPDDELAAIDILSPGENTIAAVIGITVERFTGEKAIHRFDSKTVGGWNGSDAKAAGPNAFKVIVNEKSSDWSGVRLGGDTLRLTPEQQRDTVIRFTLKGGADRFGNVSPGMAARVMVKLYSTLMVETNPFMVKKSDGPTQVVIRLRDLLPPSRGKFKNIKLIAFQFLGAAEYGYEVSDLRVEYPKANQGNTTK